MKKLIRNSVAALLVLSSFAFFACSSEDDSSASKNTNPKETNPTTGEALDLTGYVLKAELSDDFEGTELDASKWNIYTGVVYNNEQQTYIDTSMDEFKDLEPCVVVENGQLNLKAYLKNGRWYSGKVQSNDKMQFTRGYVEARLRLPKENGTWPAFWMMPNDSVYGGWPCSGELDIMEYSPRFNILAWKGTDYSTYQTVHFSEDLSNDSTSRYITYAKHCFSTPYSAFHTYGMLWEEDKLGAYYDGHLVGEYDLTKLDADNTIDNVPSKYPFDQDFYVILNLAMGGDLGGQIPTDETTQRVKNADGTLSTVKVGAVTKALYEIDYVHVYQKDSE